MPNGNKRKRAAGVAEQANRTDVLNLREAAALVRVSERTLREKARAGMVPCRRIGRQWRFSESALRAWLAPATAESLKPEAVSEGVQLYLPTGQTTQAEFPVDERKAEWGTFKHSLRAPIHRWFTYPAGFSYKAVEWSLSRHGLSQGSVVYDPFMGCGTTNVVAKKLAINSYGVEAHPFVFRIARAKLNWGISRDAVADALLEIRARVSADRRRLGGDTEPRLRDKFPELVLKCYEPATLRDLWLIRKAIARGEWSAGLSDFLFVGLAGLLRQVSSAATGWPYIAPKKTKNPSSHKDALEEFCSHASSMIADIEATVKDAAPGYRDCFHQIALGDSRDARTIVPDASVDHIFTSPPYLNNFDYADRTRLEMYFFGDAETWGDISRSVRTRLITSATTQISRSDPKYGLSDDLKAACPEAYDFLDRAVGRLGALRITKGGKKSYDHLVAGYFNDMLRVLRDCCRVLRPGARAVFVLGDSAPYGVHIPTDELIGKLGVAVGFSRHTVEVLRARGDKWKQNPQRHSVPLRESIVTLEKD